MRTKTPAQILGQWQRIAKNADSPRNIERAKKAVTTARNYWENIYRARGVELNDIDTAKVNHIWEHAAEPAIIYAMN